MNPTALVQRLYNYCTVLRDDGVSTIEYVEQLTFLLFLKMADELAKPPFNDAPIVPEGLDWQSLLDRDGDALEVHYRHILTELGKRPGMLGTIYRKAQNKIQDPAKLRTIMINLIAPTQWMSLDQDVKGDAYEGLLERGASDTKTGAGQYFTPRPLIRAIVEVMQPKPDQRIADPACGTGGFLLAAKEYIADHFDLDRDQKRFLRDEAFAGWEIVDVTARLCAMNFLLHGIGHADGDSPIRVVDSLKGDPGDRFDMVLTNPPFGRKSASTFVNIEGDEDRDDAVIRRDDFWASTSNKQLNFLQHIKTLMKVNGTAAVVLPDNVLFEGGAGEKIRRKLLHDCDLHTILRLPTGLFYKQGVKANVLFFQRRAAAAEPATSQVWIYDLRTNQHFTLKENPLQDADLRDFVACYQAGARHERAEFDRFHYFEYADLILREKVDLDITWIADESVESADNLPDPMLLAEEIAAELEATLADFAEIGASLRARSVVSTDTVHGG